MLLAKNKGVLFNQQPVMVHKARLKMDTHFILKHQVIKLFIRNRISCNNMVD